MAAPSAEGSNCTLSVAVWPGLNDIGNVLGVKVKPAPVTVAPLIVTAAVPIELTVTIWVEGVFTVTFPNATLVAPMLSVGTGTHN